MGVVEIIGGLLLLMGRLTRLAAMALIVEMLAAMALIVEMLVAIATTKIPLLPIDGVWKMAHAAPPD